MTSLALRRRSIPRLRSLRDSDAQSPDSPTTPNGTSLIVPSLALAINSNPALNELPATCHTAMCQCIEHSKGVLSFAASRSAKPSSAAFMSPSIAQGYHDRAENRINPWSQLHARCGSQHVTCRLCCIPHPSDGEGIARRLFHAVLVGIDIHKRNAPLLPPAWLSMNVSAATSLR